jgi:G3E family GTPase
MKGLLNIAGSEAVHMFQAVYDLYDVVQGTTWQQFIQQQQQQQRLSRLVVIGRFLDAAQLQAELDGCCATAAQR